MAVKKITISLDAELADEIREVAGASSTTMSAWMAEAARTKLRSHYLRLAVEAYEAEFGAFTEQEIEAARRFWDESVRASKADQDLGELIAEYEAEYGAFTAAEKEATRRFWQDSLSSQYGVTGP